jgi:hypothetical protein
MFCEGVQHYQRFCLSHLSCVKMAAFHFYLQSGKQRKVGWVGNDSLVVFGKRSMVGKGYVRRYVFIMQQPVPLSPKCGPKSPHTLTQSPKNMTVVCRIDCLAGQDEFFSDDSIPNQVKLNWSSSIPSPLLRIFVLLVHILSSF